MKKNTLLIVVGGIVLCASVIALGTSRYLYRQPKGTKTATVIGLGCAVSGVVVGVSGTVERDRSGLVQHIQEPG